jgi:peptidoglycan/xylan/chitin deacetylase (PgdA/CDA1 family)
MPIASDKIQPALFAAHRKSNDSRLSRRDFLRAAARLGLSAPAAYILAACADANQPVVEPSATPTDHPVVQPSATAASQPIVQPTAANANHPVVQRIAANATPILFSPAVASTLQAGHGWTATDNGAGDLNDTAEHLPGMAQSCRLTTAGSGAQVAFSHSDFSPALDMRDKMLRIWFKIDAATFANLQSIQVWAGTASLAKAWRAWVQGNEAADTATSPLGGEWVCVTLNPASYHANVNGADMDWSQIARIKIGITDRGQGAGVNVWIGRVDLVPNSQVFGAHGVVSFTFDDGWVGACTVAAPVLAKYGYAGTLYFITDEPTVGGSDALSLAQVRSLKDSYGWEVSAHCYVNADHGFTRLSDSQLRADLASLQQWLQDQGYYAYDEAYPNGQFSPAVLNTVSQYMSSGRLAENRTIETLPVADPYRLRSIVIGNDTPAIGPDTTLGNIGWYVQQIYQYGGWLILTMHQPVVGPARGSLEVSQAYLSTLASSINALGIPVKTVREVLGI